VRWENLFSRFLVMAVLDTVARQYCIFREERYLWSIMHVVHAGIPFEWNNQHTLPGCHVTFQEIKQPSPSMYGNPTKRRAMTS
jgi:hypothetical protein